MEDMKTFWRFVLTCTLKPVGKIQVGYDDKGHGYVQSPTSGSIERNCKAVHRINKLPAALFPSDGIIVEVLSEMGLFESEVKMAPWAGGDVGVCKLFSSDGKEQGGWVKCTSVSVKTLWACGHYLPDNTSLKKKMATSTLRLAIVRSANSTANTDAPVPF